MFKNQVFPLGCLSNNRGIDASGLYRELEFYPTPTLTEYDFDNANARAYHCLTCRLGNSGVSSTLVLSFR